MVAWAAEPGGNIGLEKQWARKEFKKWLVGDASAYLRGRWWFGFIKVGIQFCTRDLCPRCPATYGRYAYLRTA